MVWKLRLFCIDEFYDSLYYQCEFDINFIIKYTYLFLLLILFCYFFTWVPLVFFFNKSFDCLYNMNFLNHLRHYFFILYFSENYVNMYIHTYIQMYIFSINFFLLMLQYWQSSKSDFSSSRNSWNWGWGDRFFTWTRYIWEMSTGSWAVMGGGINFIYESHHIVIYWKIRYLFVFNLITGSWSQWCRTV